MATTMSDCLLKATLPQGRARTPKSRCCPLYKSLSYKMQDERNTPYDGDPEKHVQPMHRNNFDPSNNEHLRLVLKRNIVRSNESADDNRARSREGSKCTNTINSGSLCNRRRASVSP
mmetsp:Transcript_13017/g.21526  ORF Transcript_13017/g.21526 Transcript_13017/m.21526 type:complete len:117 (+) Transcript_13017:70-420(+)